MALAIVSSLGHVGHSARFSVDIGSNRWFAWAVGSHPVTHSGLTMLGQRTLESGLLGPLRVEERGRTVIDIPADAFSDPDHFVQIVSFRTQSMEGPAVSDLVRPTALGAPAPSSLRVPPSRVPSPARGAPTSEAMFLESVIGVIQGLMPAISQLVPAVAPVLAAISGGGNRTASAGGAARPNAAPGVPSDLAALLARPETGQLLAQLARQIASLVGGPAAAAPVPVAAVRDAPSPSPPTDRSMSSASSVDRAQYSEAKVLPAALLAALPALMPLLQQVLTPQTVQSVLQTADPNRLLTTITSGIGDLARIGIEADQALRDHLRQLNPGLGDDLAARLLESMSVSASRQRHRRAYRRVESVALTLSAIEDAEPGTDGMIAFSPDKAWAFPVAISTPRPIRAGRLQVLIEERDDLRPRHEFAVDVQAAGSGPLTTVDIPLDVVWRLSPGTHYHLKLTLTWDAGGEVLGTSMLQTIVVAPQALAGDVSPDAELVPLDDVATHRDFWHRVWAADFDDGHRRVDLTVSYEYRLDPGVRGVARLDTELDASVPEGRWELTGSARSGLRIGPDGVNDLLHRLTGERLEPADLAVLADRSLASRLGGSARARVQLKGRPGDGAAIWVWPEVKLYRVTVRRPGTLAPTGQVYSFVADEVRVPFPALAHVVGASS